MNRIVDKTSGGYWMAFGQGFTTDAGKAHLYTDDEAMSLVILYPSSYFVGADGQRVDAPMPDAQSPNRTRFMVKYDMVWARIDDMWFPVERQILAMGALSDVDDTSDEEPPRVA